MQHQTATGLERDFYHITSEVRQTLARYFDVYNRLRPHSTLDGKTPDAACFNQLPLAAAA